MDFENIHQNMNTRVVFKEPRGMVRWLQLLFAIIAVSTICDFNSNIGIEITCPTSIPTPIPSSTSTTSSTQSPSPSVQVSSPQPSNATAASAAAVTDTPNTITPKFIVKYPFDFQDVVVNNSCPGGSYQFKPPASLSGSPQFFVMTGFLSLLYAIGTLLLYLLFSSTYEIYPIVPVADLIITALLGLLWFVSSSAFSSGVSMLKSTISYENLAAQLCPQPFTLMPGVSCKSIPDQSIEWKSINVGLVSGFTSFFLWCFGCWFVFKETHWFTSPRPL